MDRTMSRSLPYLPRYQSASPARSSRLGGRRFTSLRSVSQPSSRILYVMGEPTRAFISPHHSPSPQRSYRYTLISTKLKQPVSRVTRSRSASDMMSSHLYTSSEEALPSALREESARRKAESCDDMYHKGPFFPDVTASESGVSMGGSEDSSLYGGEDDAMSQNSFGSSSAFFEVTVDSELDRMEGDSLGDRTLDILYEHDLDHRGAGVKAARHARPPYRDVISPDSNRSSPSLTYGDARKRELMLSPSWDLDKTVSRFQVLRVSIPGEVKSPRDGVSGGRDGDKKSLPSTPLAQSTPHVSPRGGTARLSVKACWDIDDPYGEDADHSGGHKLKPGAARALFESDVSDPDLSRSPRVDESSCYSSNSEDNFSDVSSATVASPTSHRKTKLVKKPSDRPASARVSGVGGSGQAALVSVTGKERNGESGFRDGVPRRNVEPDPGHISRTSDVTTGDSCFSQAEAMLREQATTPRASARAGEGETSWGQEGEEWWAVFNIESAQARKAEGSLSESGDAGSNYSQDVHVVKPVKVNIPLISAGKHGQDKLRRLSRSPPCSGGMSPSLELSASGDAGDWFSDCPNTNNDQAPTGSESGELMKFDRSGFHTRPGESALAEENEQRWSGLVFPHGVAAAADGSATCGADQEENTRVCESSAEPSASGKCSDVTSTATWEKQGRGEEEGVEAEGRGEEEGVEAEGRGEEEAEAEWRGEEEAEPEKFGSEGRACQGEETQLYPGSVKNFKSQSCALDNLPSPAHLYPSVEEGKGSNYRSLHSPTQDTLDTSTNCSTSTGVKGHAEAINEAIHPWVESPSHKTDRIGQFSSDKHDDENTREVTRHHYVLGNNRGGEGPGAETISRYLPAESPQVAEWNGEGSASLWSGPTIQLEASQGKGRSTPEKGGEEEESWAVRDEKEKSHDADSVEGSPNEKPVEEVNRRTDRRICDGLEQGDALVSANPKVLSSSQHPARELSREPGIVKDTVEGEVTVHKKQGREATQDTGDQEQTASLSPCRRAGAQEEEENIDPGFHAAGREHGDQVSGRLVTGEGREREKRGGQEERQKRGGQEEEEEEDMEWQMDPRRVRVFATAQTVAHDDSDDNNSNDVRPLTSGNIAQSSSSSSSSSHVFTHSPDARPSLSPSSSRADTKSCESGRGGDPAVQRTNPGAEMSGDAAGENTRESGQSAAPPRHGSPRQQENVFRDFTNSRPCAEGETSILDEASGGGEEEEEEGRRRKLGNKEFCADEAAWRGRRGSVERGEEFLVPPQPSRKQVLLEEISTTKRVKRILRETVEETVTVERKTLEPLSSGCVHLTDGAGQSVDIVTRSETVIKEDEDCVTTTTTTTAYSDQAPATTTTPSRSDHASMNSENLPGTACSVNDTGVEVRYDSVSDSTIPPSPMSCITSEQSLTAHPPPLSPDADSCEENTSAVLSPSTSRAGENTNGSLDRHQQACVSVDEMDASVTLRQSQLDSLQEQLSQLTSNLSHVGTRDPARREAGSVYQDHAEATSVLKQIVRGDSGTFSRFSRFSDAETSVATRDGFYSSALKSEEKQEDAALKGSPAEREEYDNDYDYVTTDLPTRGSSRSVSQHQHHHQHQLQLLKPGQLKASSLWTLQEETESVLDGLSPRPSPKRSLATLNSNGSNEDTPDPCAPRESLSGSGAQEKSMWTSDENKNLQLSRSLLSGFHQQRVSEWSELEESDGNYSSISTTESTSHRSSSYCREQTPLSDTTEPSPLREMSGKLDYRDTRAGAGLSPDTEMISSFNDFVSGLDPRLFPRESVHQSPVSGPDGSSSLLTSAERDSGLLPPKVFKSSLAVTVTSPTDSETSTLHDLSSSLEIFAKMGGSMSAHMDGYGATSASSSFLLSPSPCATPREDFLNTSKHSWQEETLSEGSSRLHALDLDLSRISSCASPSPSDVSESSSSHYICTGTAEVKKTSVYDYDLPPAPTSTLRPKPCLKRPASDDSDWKTRQTEERLKQFDQLLADFNKQTCGALAFSDLVFLDQSRAEGASTTSTTSGVADTTSTSSGVADTTSSSSGVADTASTGYDDLYKAFSNDDAEKKQNNVCIVLEDEGMSSYRFKRFLKKSHSRRHKGRRMLRFLSRLGCVSEGVHSPDMAANRKLVVPVPQKGEAPPTFSTDSMPARQRISNPVLISSTSFHHHHGMVPVSHVTGQVALQTVDSPTSSNHSLDSFRSRADSAYSSISESLSVGGPCSPSRAPPSPSRALLRSPGSSAFRPKGSVDSAYSSTSGVRMWSEGDVMPLPSPSIASGDSDMLAALTDVFEQLDVCESEIDSALLSRMRYGHRQAHSNK